MLIEEKIIYLKKYLSKKNNGYSDIVKSELSINFFEFKTYDFNFLNKLETKEDIEKKIEFAVSKYILHEHEADINEIVYEYLL